MKLPQALQKPILRSNLGSPVLAIAFLFMPGALFAGDSESSGKEPLILNDEAPALVKPTADIRARYEFGDQDTLDSSHAGTVRGRLGLLTREISGFQFFGEYEGTLAVDRDSYRATSVHGPDTKTVIADPESHELNQLWGSYETGEELIFVKGGRQAINLDNQRYVGGVAWRQNMQTFDAAAVTIKPAEDLEVYYGYLWQANRIFGSDVVAPPQTDFTGNTHLVNAKYDGLSFGTLTTYAYFMDLHNEAGDANSNNSFGLSLAGEVFDTPLDYYAEYGYQTDAFDSPLDYGAHYAHGKLSAPLGDTGLTSAIGLEYLGSDNGVGYQFPLGTNHAFNGFADRFLMTPADGLTDLHASLGCKLPWEVGATAIYHAFWDANWSDNYGQEADLVLTKKLGNGFSVLAKGAYFWGQSGFPDTARASIELNFKY